MTLSMEFTLILFSELILLISMNNGEPVININGCCSNQSPGANCIEENKKLMSNITNLLNEHEKRLEAILGAQAPPFRIRDCQDIMALGKTTTEIYTIYPEGTVGLQVRCDMDTADGGWTVIQRRISDSDFNKTWNEYQIGFGNLSGNFWLGNQQIHAISSSGWYELRVDLVSLDEEFAYAEYNVFRVGDIDSGYKLTVDGYSGNAGESLMYGNGQRFSTKDKDNDSYISSCAQTYMGAWWYKTCGNSNLNGKYGATDYKGPCWYSFKGSHPMQKTEMKIRRWRPSVTDSL